jgi:spore maturation protein CgeB
VTLNVFYDMDPGVTLHRFLAGEPVDYIGPRLLRDFDLVLSYTGGKALTLLREAFGARSVAPLYGSVDPEQHSPAPPNPRFESDLSYLGTYAADRQPALDMLFLEPARRLSERRFCLGGALYPAEFPWTDNIFFVRHLPPAEHSQFYSSSRWTLNVTRVPMADMGYCPSARFFEAASCGTPVLTDWFDGLEAFFRPGEEIVVAHATGDAVDAIEMDERQRARIARAARERTLAEHTADARAVELEDIIDGALGKRPARAESRVGA